MSRACIHFLNKQVQLFQKAPETAPRLRNILCLPHFSIITKRKIWVRNEAFFEGDYRVKKWDLNAAYDSKKVNFIAK